MTDAVRDGDVGFSETRWIVSEDQNVEHLLDVFTSLDAKSDDVWRVCHRCILHLIRPQRILGSDWSSPVYISCFFCKSLTGTNLNK